VLSPADLEIANQFRVLGASETMSFQPSKTMIRSLDELYQPQKETLNKFFQPSPVEEPFQGWAPDI